MRFRSFVLAAAALLVAAQPIAAQAPAAATSSPAGVMGDLLRDIDQAEKKIVGLAKAMPDAGLTWRPSKEARSTGEVLMHVAADNYFIPAVLDIPAPAETGVTKQYESAMAFEKKTMNRDAMVAELEKSFAFLKKSMASMTDAKLEAPVSVFGQKNTMRGMWLLATTHLHEHLGQLIAYARSNNVVPPWSNQ